MGKKRAKYTDEELAEIAAGYDTLKEFFTERETVYKAIRKRGLFDKLCGHMKRENEVTLSDEELEEIASRYDVLKELREKESHAYRAITQRGLLNRLCGHMERTVNGRKIEDLAAIAAKYDDLNEFYNKEHNVYESIRKRGLKDILCAHMRRHDGGRIPDEVLAEIAAKYDALKDFIKKDRNTYDIIKRRGMIDELCGHMKREKVVRYTEDDLREIALQYDDFHEFSIKEVGVLSAIRRRGLLLKLCGHMKRLNILIEKDPESRGFRGASEEELAAIALEYDTLKDFVKNDYTVYRTIRDRGLYDKLCRHLQRAARPTLSNEELAEIALRYDTVKDMLENDESAYVIIKRRGLAEKLLGHMKPIGSWIRRKIYAFTFSDGYAYVGLSFDPDYRYRQHTNDDKSSPIYKHIEETGASFEFKILTDWLDIDVVGKVEDKYIKQYAADGWKMLNRVKGGALGFPKPSKKRKRD